MASTFNAEQEEKNNINFQTKDTNNIIEQSSYPQRMTEILEYLEESPMSITGHKMYYKKTSQLSSKRDLSELYDSLETLDFDPQSLSSIHHAQVCRGLLYLSMNAIDECHNLVTPLSWPSSTSFGGNPIPGSSASQNACYGVFPLSESINLEIQ